MESQNIQENNQFKLSYSERKTDTVELKKLAQFVLQNNIDSDIALPLSQAVQKQLGDSFKKLPIETQTNPMIRLIEKSFDRE